VRRECLRIGRHVAHNGEGNGHAGAHSGRLMCHVMARKRALTRPCFLVALIASSRSPSRCPSKSRSTTLRYLLLSPFHRLTTNLTATKTHHSRSRILSPQSANMQSMKDALTKGEGGKRNTAPPNNETIWTSPANKTELRWPAESQPTSRRAVGRGEEAPNRRSEPSRRGVHVIAGHGKSGQYALQRELPGRHKDG